MKLQDSLNNSYHVELYVSDVNVWKQFFITNMGFNLVHAKKHAALLSNGYTLLELQEEKSEAADNQVGNSQVR
jgi:catechol-2,3-dioxygenase